MNQDNVIQQPDPTQITLRGAILEHAKRLTEGDRNKVYGDPDSNMSCFAHLVDAYLGGLYSAGRSGLNATDGAMILALLKISRVAANQTHWDSYIDLAAYAAIGGECAGVTKPVDQLREGGKNA